MYTVHRLIQTTIPVHIIHTHTSPEELQLSLDLRYNSALFDSVLCSLCAHSSSPGLHLRSPRTIRSFSSFTRSVYLLRTSVQISGCSRFTFKPFFNKYVERPKRQRDEGTLKRSRDSCWSSQ